MNSYFITRAGTGVSVERRAAYKYRRWPRVSRDRRADPFIVTVEPSAADALMHLNCHKGQEMNYVLEGRLLISVSGKELVLGVGDSLYFDSGLPHGTEGARRQAGTFPGDNNVGVWWRNFLSRTVFTSQEDYIKEFPHPRPRGFQFAYDVVDAYAAEEPDKKALLWTDDRGGEIQFTLCRHEA